MEKDEENEEMPENKEMNKREKRKQTKKYLYYISISVSILGILGTVILMMLSYYVLDTTHKETLNQLEQTDEVMMQIELSLDSSMNEISNLETTVDEMDLTIRQLKTSITMMGNTLKSFGQTVSGINFGGLIGFQEEGRMMKETGDAFIQTGDSLDEINLKAHKGAISKFKDEIAILKQEISDERSAMEGAQKTSNDVFLALKAMAIIFCILEIMLFGVILMNCLAGM
ncbi:MAG: hypothetical protein ABII22_00635 [Candidatus Micrarchaeota archaeon]